jgi:uncharacterized protein YbaP (TraB family)
LQYGLDVSGRPLSASLSPVSAAQLEQALASLGLSPALVEPMEPWLAVTTLVSLQIVALGYDPALGADVTLQARSQAAGKTLTGLESARQQMAMLDALPPATQAEWLRVTLEDWEQGAEVIERLARQWLSGDVEAFTREIGATMDDVPGLADALLRDRNEAFARWIVQRMERPGTVFFAVGAGHLAGPHSVQQFLHERGLPVARL